MRELVENIINEKIGGTQLFVVELRLKPNRIDVFLDGDNGVNIKECASLSNYLHRRLEEGGVDTGHYYVEVSSPGLDRPLHSLREYKKNVGRKLQIKNQQNKLIKGSLVYVDDSKILLSAAGGKKEEPVEFSNIKEAKVVI